MARQRVVIEANDRKLSGRFFTPTIEPVNSAVLFVHGFGARGRTCEQYSKRLAQKGIASLAFDLSGHGDSEREVGEMSVSDHLEDVCAAYDYLVRNKKVPVDSERLGIAGMSYGGYLAALAIQERRVKSLLTRSAPLYPDLLRDKPRRDYTDEEALHTDPETSNAALQAMRQFGGHISLISCELDTVIPLATQDAYKQAAPHSERFVLAGAQHSLDAEAQQQFQPILQTWAAEL